MPGWQVAERLQAAGVAAIIVPSQARGAGPADATLVVRRPSRDPPQAVRAADDHARLPPEATTLP